MNKLLIFIIVILSICGSAKALTVFESYDNEVALNRGKALNILLSEYKRDQKNYLLNYKIGKHYEQDRLFRNPFMVKYYFNYLELAPKNDPNHDDVVFTIVEYYLEKGVKYGDKSIVDSPNSLPPYDAINVSSLLDSIFNKNVPNFNLYLGLLYMIEKDYGQAIKYFEITQIEKTSYRKSKWLYNNLGYAFIKCNNLKDAEKALRMAEFIDPSNIYVHVNLGYVYFHTESYLDAVKQYKQALGINPDYKKAIQGLEDSKRMLHRNNGN